MSDLRSERIEVIGLDHIYLAVSDLERSEKFYDAVFGILDFRKSDSAIAGHEHRHYFNKITQISIRPAQSGNHDPYAPGLHHLCLQVSNNADVDRAAALLGGAGVHTTKPALYPDMPAIITQFSFPTPMESAWKSSPGGWGDGKSQNAGTI